VDVNAVAPLGAAPDDLGRLRDADFNVVLYPEDRVTGGAMAAAQLRPARDPHRADRRRAPRATSLPRWRSWPASTRTAVLADALPARTWYATSVDSTYLTGKRVFVFGDATHAVAAARIASREMGFTVVGLGTYSREFAREVREAAKLYGVEALITDDYLDVEQKIAELQPELVLGTQMERHIAKRLGVPCAVISAPVHVQDFPARYSPQMGFEGANVMFDSWVHPLMMGLEEHLIGMFRGDAEFHEDAAPSHLGGAATPRPADQPIAVPAATSTEVPTTTVTAAVTSWGADAEKELKKIPFFVRGKARRNTEIYARDKGLPVITVETLYDAKAHFSR
jgi:light-independent protochlorophyllide reductase subunit B